MSNNSIKILLIEDNPGDRRLIQEMLAEEPAVPYDFKYAERLSTGLEAVAREESDVIILDLGLPDSQGIDTLKRVQAQFPKKPVVVLTGLNDKELSLQVMREGAQDYLIKGCINCDALWRIIRYSIGRKQREEALRKSENNLQESEARYRDLYDNAPNAYFSISSADGTIIRHNHTATQLLGYDTETLLGMKVLDLYADTPDGKTKAERVFKQLIAGESIQDTELQMKHRDGHPIWISLSVEPAKDTEGKVIESRSTVIDISKRKELEKQLIQSQRLEAIGRLSGGIAHDFNNLMTAVVGYSDLLTMKLGHDSDICKDIEQIKKAGQSAASLSRQLLAFGRKQILQPRVVDLNHIVDDLDKVLQRVIGENISLITVLEPKLGRILVDPGQMEQIIMNIAVNARDAMPNGGKITIETANVYQDERYTQKYLGFQPGYYVMLAMTDTGTGMDEEAKSHIFEPFFTTKEEGKGTGLGMSTVYGIVKQSNGHIFVYTEPEKGTTFKIYLPRIEGNAEPEGKEEVPVKVLNGTETILVVEDADSIRNLSREVLEVYGYRVLEAESGEDALKVSEEHEGPIHLMVADIVMPGINVRDLTDRLKTFRPQMKVLYMSGYTENAIAHQGVLKPGTPFLQKPFTPVGLVRKVREILDS